MLILQKNDVLTEAELDEAVYAVQQEALRQGMIPIAGIMSERLSDGRHRVVGFGWNHLREGIPGIHGETGAIMNMGRLEGGYRNLVATSSLSPCPFCQNTLACQLGVKEVRILDVTNYSPDFSGYEKVGLKPVVKEHAGIIQTFGQWVNDPANSTIWNRDIGEWDAFVQPVIDVVERPERVAELMAMAHRQAAEAAAGGEAPIGAVIVDHLGEVLGVGHSQLRKNNDPSLVAGMSAWRACGARDHWMDKTLFLTAGPDHIAYSMFHIFRFGQLVVGSTAVFKGQTDAVRALDKLVTVLNDTASDAALQAWIAASKPEAVAEYLGADFQR